MTEIRKSVKTRQPSVGNLTGKTKMLYYSLLQLSGVIFVLKRRFWRGFHLTEKKKKVFAASIDTLGAWKQTWDADCCPQTKNHTSDIG